MQLRFKPRFRHFLWTTALAGAFVGLVEGTENLWVGFRSSSTVRRAPVAPPAFVPPAVTPQPAIKRLPMSIPAVTVLRLPAVELKSSPIRLPSVPVDRVAVGEQSPPVTEIQPVPQPEWEVDPILVASNPGHSVLVQQDEGEPQDRLGQHDVIPESTESDSLPAESTDLSDTDPSDPLRLLPSTLTHDWNDTATPLAAASEQASQLLKRASTRASRGAIFSARNELEGSLGTLSQALDLHYGTTGFSDCLQLGLLAMDEAADFTPLQGKHRMSVDVALTVQRHRSRILSSEGAADISPVEAARRYYSYAQEHLVAAAGRSPIAAHALFGMGKIYMGMAQSDSDAERVYGPRAMVLHQSALLINSSHHLAANELGVLLVRFGRLREARDVFKYCLAMQTNSAAWKNLADVHDRLGEPQLAELARHEAQRTTGLAKHSNPQTVVAPNGLTVHWVDKATFERAGAAGEPGVPVVPATALKPPAATAARPRPSSHW